MTPKNKSSIDTILSGRSSENLSSCIFDLKKGIFGKNDHTLFLTSPTDLGVCRNGGRRGSSYAPQALLNSIKKMTSNSFLEKYRCAVVNVSSNQEETDFKKAQIESSNKIHGLLKKFSGKQVFHLGGGHDHIYPLLKALENFNKKIKVVNIDAHLDTRNDSHPHSGNPFRQFDLTTTVDFSLIQIGTHNFCNSKPTSTKLSKGKMKIISFEKLLKETNNFCKSLNQLLNKEIKFNKNEIVVLSLDCDAIDSSTMEGVSAVNHRGMPIKSIEEIFSFFNKKNKANPLITGIYEYNPLYDNLSQKGARAISSVIYSSLMQRS